MTALASTAELTSWLGGGVLDPARATLALDVASGDIRDFCGWSISQETGATFTLDGPGRYSGTRLQLGPPIYSDVVFLKTRLLTAVTSVTENGAALTAGTGFDWKQDGTLIRVGTAWTDKPRSIVAVVTHGYAVVPDRVKGVCLQAAARKYHQTTAGVRSYQVDMNEPFTDTVDVVLGLTPGEKADLVNFSLYDWF